MPIAAATPRISSPAPSPSFQTTELDFLYNRLKGVTTTNQSRWVLRAKSISGEIFLARPAIFQGRRVAKPLEAYNARVILKAAFDKTVSRLFGALQVVGSAVPDAQRNSSAQIRKAVNHIWIRNAALSLRDQPIPVCLRQVNDIRSDLRTLQASKARPTAGSDSMRPAHHSPAQHLIPRGADLVAQSPIPDAHQKPRCARLKSPVSVVERKRAMPQKTRHVAVENRPSGQEKSPVSR